jgi:hypothetical protein
MRLIHLVVLFLIPTFIYATDWVLFTENWSRTPKLEYLKKNLPRIYWDILSASTDEEAKNLWGYAVNFDEVAKAIIVPETLLSCLTDAFRVPPPFKISSPSERWVVHSGIQHTYGYLFSNLITRYGYKRERWTLPTIDQGFGFKQPTIHPNPKKGSLFYNVTILAAKIVGIKMSKTLQSKTALEIKKFKPDPNKHIRIEERIQGANPATLYTDFYLFGNSNQKSGALLVYSVKTKIDKNPKLITLFPVDLAFVNRMIEPHNFGNNKPIQLRYNAYLNGLYQNSQLIGVRKLYYGKTKNR